MDRARARTSARSATARRTASCRARCSTRRALFVETQEAFEPTPVGCAELDGDHSATELGEVLLGRKPGRTARDEITVYKAMGHVVEDIAAAELVYAAALETRAGRLVEL